MVRSAFSLVLVSAGLASPRAKLIWRIAGASELKSFMTVLVERILGALLEILDARPHVTVMHAGVVPAADGLDVGIQGCG
jgi:hypothetical protein